MTLDPPFSFFTCTVNCWDMNAKWRGAKCTLNTLVHCKELWRSSQPPVQSGQTLFNKRFQMYWGESWRVLKSLVSDLQSGNEVCRNSNSDWTSYCSIIFLSTYSFIFILYYIYSNLLYLLKEMYPKLPLCSIQWKQ